MIAGKEPEQARPLNYVALTEILLLGGTAALLLSKWLRGLLPLYIHPRYTALVVVCGAVLLLMAAVRVRALFEPVRQGASGWLYLLLAIPLLLGTLVPARPLGADTLASRGLGLNAEAPATRWTPEDDARSAEWDLLQWSVALSMRGEELNGRPADVIGFVFQDEQLGRDHFYIARYVVTCCSADGAAVGLPVRWPGGTDLPADSWMRIRGTLDHADIGGVVNPVLIAETVEPVIQPENPYLYP